MHGLITLFLEVIALVIILLLVRLFCSCRPCLCNKNDCGIDHLDDNRHVVGHCDRVGCFDGSCNSCDGAVGSSNHGCKRQEDEPSSSI